VTGGTGYIAGYCIRELLTRGFRVRTTVRYLKTNKKLKPLYDYFNIPNMKGKIEIVEAYLESDEG